MQVPMPILHSRDLLNWELIGHAYGAQPPYDLYSKPQTVATRGRTA
jgi:beta-xylosidase